MSAIRALLVSLLFVFSGQTVAQSASPDASLAPSSAGKVVIIACYVKKSSAFSAPSPAAREDLSEFIKGETDLLVRGLEKGLADAGFAVSVAVNSGPCKVKDGAESAITIPMMFEMTRQASDEDLIVARAFIKEFGSKRADGVVQRKVNGVLGKVRAQDVVGEVVTEVVTAIKAVQKKAVPPTAAVTTKTE
jgi:hypothetical protein